MKITKIADGKEETSGIGLKNILMHEADEKNVEAEGKKLLRMRKNWEKKKKVRNTKLNEKIINIALPDMIKIVGKEKNLVEQAPI